MWVQIINGRVTVVNYYRIEWELQRSEFLSSYLSLQNAEWGWHDHRCCSPKGPHLAWKFPKVALNSIWI